MDLSITRLKSSALHIPAAGIRSLDNIAICNNLQNAIRTPDSYDTFNVFKHLVKYPKLTNIISGHLEELKLVDFKYFDQGGYSILLDTGKEQLINITPLDQGQRDRVNTPEVFQPLYRTDIEIPGAKLKLEVFPKFKTVESLFHGKQLDSKTIEILENTLKHSLALKELYLYDDQWMNLIVAKNGKVYVIDSDAVVDHEYAKTIPNVKQEFERGVKLLKTETNIDPNIRYVEGEQEELYPRVVNPSPLSNVDHLYRSKVSRNIPDQGHWRD